MRPKGLMYHRVRDAKGNIVTIQDVTNGYKSDKYYHEFYDVEMIFVKGNKGRKIGGRTPHFRIKNARGGKESDLHKFAKEYYKKRFDEGKEFNVWYYVYEKCTLYNRCQTLGDGKFENCCNKKLRKFNLKEIYDTCEEEEWSEKRRGDLVLSNSKNPDVDLLFIELAYKHECEKEKILSGIQIIEIMINGPEDIGKDIIEENTLMYFDSPSPYVDRPKDFRFYGVKRNFTKKNDFREYQITRGRKGNANFGNENKTTNKIEASDVLHKYLLCDSSLKMCFKDKELKTQARTAVICSAIKDGYKIRDCQFCRAFNAPDKCKLREGYTKISPHSGIRYPIAPIIKGQPLKIADTYDEACFCKYFNLDMNKQQVLFEITKDVVVFGMKVNN